MEERRDDENVIYVIFIVKIVQNSLYSLVLKNINLLTHHHIFVFGLLKRKELFELRLLVIFP